MLTTKTINHDNRCRAEETVQNECVVRNWDKLQICKDVQRHVEILI